MLRPHCRGVHTFIVGGKALQFGDDAGRGYTDIVECQGYGRAGSLVPYQGADGDGSAFGDILGDQRGALDSLQVTVGCEYNITIDQFDICTIPAHSITPVAAEGPLITPATVTVALVLM